MGEEEKKPEAEAKKPEEAKKEEPVKTAAVAGEDGGGEKKDGGEAAQPPPPPPPTEVVMQVYMHCEGCARKVKRCLKGFEGVEEVTTDCKTHKVVVKGKKAAEDPMKVVERVQKKSGRKVELLSPMPPPKVEEKKEEVKEQEKPKLEEKKEEVIAVVLKVHMHCDACAQEIKKRILKMKGVQSAEPELKTSQVTVKGVFDPAKLVEYVYKRTGKHALVVKQEPADKKPEGEAADKKPEGETKDDKAKAEGGEKEKAEGDKKPEGGAEDKEKKDGGTPEEAAAGKPELKRNEFVYYYPRYVEYNAYPPQIFSDENPNACSVM